MKKKHIKEIKRIAAQMPVIGEVKGHKKEDITGAQLIRGGLKELKDGTEVNPKGKYIRTIAVNGPVNHVQKMKAAYKRGGADAVKEYIQQHELK